MISHTILTIATKGKGLYPFTRQVSEWLRKQSLQDGALIVFLQHTSCSLVIQEKCRPPMFALDLRDFFERLVPEDSEDYRHTSEGPRRHDIAHTINADSHQLDYSCHWRRHGVGDVARLVCLRTPAVSSPSPRGVAVYRLMTCR